MEIKRYQEIIESTAHLILRFAQEGGFEGKVFVVDNQRISVTQRQSVLDAMAMAEKGLDAAVRELPDGKLETHGGR